MPSTSTSSIAQCVNTRGTFLLLRVHGLCDVGNRPFIDKYCQPTTESQYLGEPNHGLDLGVEHQYAVYSKAGPGTERGPSHFLLEMQAWDPANPREDPRAYTYSVNVAGGDDASQAVHLPDLILSLAKSGAGSRLDEMRPVLVVCQCILSRLSTKEGREVSDLLQRMVFRLARYVRVQFRREPGS
jgi:hypothetical protein